VPEVPTDALVIDGSVVVLPVDRTSGGRPLGTAVFRLSSVVVDRAGSWHETGLGGVVLRWTRRVAMTVSSRLLAAKCRETFAADPAALSGAGGQDPAGTPDPVDAEPETVAPLENTELTAT
jgi:hypothetical protein